MRPPRNPLLYHTLPEGAISAPLFKRLKHFFRLVTMKNNGECNSVGRKVIKAKDLGFVAVVVVRVHNLSTRSKINRYKRGYREDWSKIIDLTAAKKGK